MKWIMKMGWTRAWLAGAALLLALSFGGCAGGYYTAGGYGDAYYYPDYAPQYGYYGYGGAPYYGYDPGYVGGFYISGARHGRYYGHHHYYGHWSGERGVRGSSGPHVGAHAGGRDGGRGGHH